MQITLDYYRILGVPVQASEELIEQAYRDRCRQLPHREYSEAAIASRQKLLDRAHEVLRDSSSRSEYNNHFFPQSPSEVQPAAPEAARELGEELWDETASPPENLPDIGTPSLEVGGDLLLGALSILQELGEYELLLDLARPYLDHPEELASLADKPEQFEQDLILAVVLAQQELGREQWQQGDYELAATSLEGAYHLLREKELFANLQGELNNDLKKLIPYRIIDLLKGDGETAPRREKGINLLKQMLNERGGIEGQQIDKSGLNLDEFLRFIQQVRVYLSAQEQQKLFEEEAKRPSPAASYLAVYALIARGFAHKKPELIIRAKNLLISLIIHQDVYIEQAICALLLGQTTEAEFAITQSQEQEIIDYIKQNSQGSPDLLPGLCFYTEKWLQAEVFPQFRDLRTEKCSLKEYFADVAVQDYLENLSLLYLEPAGAAAGSPKETVPPSSISADGDLEADRQPLNSPAPELGNGQVPRDSQVQPKLEFSGGKPSLKDGGARADEPVLTFVEAQREATSQHQQDLADFNSLPEGTLELANSSGTTPEGEARNRLKQRAALPSPKLLASLPPNAIWLMILSVVGSILLFTIHRVLTGQKPEPLRLTLTEPVIEIPPKQEIKPQPPVEEAFNQAKALEVLENWLKVKELSTGPKREMAALESILTGKLLARWRAIAEDMGNNNAYRRYQHQVKIESVKLLPGDRAIIEANIKEISDYYQNGALNRSRSYSDHLLVRYELVKKNDRWLIEDIKVIRSY